MTKRETAAMCSATTVAARVGTVVEARRHKDAERRVYWTIATNNVAVWHRDFVVAAKMVEAALTEQERGS